MLVMIKLGLILTEKEREKLLVDMQRTQKVMENLEEKLSSVKEECVDVKERLNRALLEKEVIEQEKSHLSEVLSKTELQKAEIEMEVNKVKTEEIALKDALVKLQSLNEALGQDKAELGRIIRHMEMEKETLGNEKNEIEQEKISIREELIRVEQEKVFNYNLLTFFELSWFLSKDIRLTDSLSVTVFVRHENLSIWLMTVFLSRSI